MPRAHLVQLLHHNAQGSCRLHLHSIDPYRHPARRPSRPLSLYSKAMVLAAKADGNTTSLILDPYVDRVYQPCVWPVLAMHFKI